MSPRARPPRKPRPGGGKGQERDRQANRGYHDRIAFRYDEIYSGPRWEIWHETGWAALKNHLPSGLRAPAADLGCGTGWYGLRLARSGFTVTLADLSPRMIETARRKAETMNLPVRPTFVQADIMDLSALPRQHFALVVAQGDVLSFAARPPHALRQIRAILRPNGVLVASVDQTYAAIEHYAEKGNWEGLERLLLTGEMEWLAHRPAERFTVHTFTPDGLRRMLEQAGFELLDLFGKTILPLKAFEATLEDPAVKEAWRRLERKVCRRAEALALASHLQFAARIVGLENTAGEP